VAGLIYGDNAIVPGVNDVGAGVMYAGVGAKEERTLGDKEIIVFNNGIYLYRMKIRCCREMRVGDLRKCNGERVNRNGCEFIGKSKK
jgi:hypothetical protein